MARKAKNQASSSIFKLAVQLMRQVSFSPPDITLVPRKTHLWVKREMFKITRKKRKLGNPGKVPRFESSIYRNGNARCNASVSNFGSPPLLWQPRPANQNQESSVLGGDKPNSNIFKLDGGHSGTNNWICSKWPEKQRKQSSQLGHKLSSESGRTSKTKFRCVTLAHDYFGTTSWKQAA